MCTASKLKLMSHDSHIASSTKLFHEYFSFSRFYKALGNSAEITIISSTFLNICHSFFLTHISIYIRPLPSPCLMFVTLRLPFKLLTCSQIPNPYFCLDMLKRKCRFKYIMIEKNVVDLECGCGVMCGSKLPCGQTVIGSLLKIKN